MLGLYIHIPFCRKICPYCDFYKMVVSDELKTKYIRAVIKEMQLKKLECISFDTLYIGGGTPSSLSISQLKMLLESLNQKIDLKALKEFTFECNPEDITRELLSILKKYYVTRLSIGIQTLDDHLQHILQRRFSYLDLQNAILLVRELGFENYSFDLMYGFFNQSIVHIKNDLDLLLKFCPKHLSIYSLIVEEHTYFKLMENEKYKLECDEHTQADMYQFIISYLESNGLSQYETSNFAVPGYESIHNQIYWDDEQYYSLGAGASSYIGNTRSVMTKKIHQYIDELDNGILPKTVDEVLSVDEQIDEYLMMNLRKTTGVNLTGFKKRFNEDLLIYYPSLMTLIKDENLLVLEFDHVYIKKEFRYVANYIIVKIISSR